MSKFQVIVANVGLVWGGNNYMQASAQFERYVKASKPKMRSLNWIPASTNCNPRSIP